MNLFSQDVLDKSIFENHCEAASNYLSTYQLYTVVFIEDGTSNEPREVCLTGADLMFALRDEWDLGLEDFTELMNKVKSSHNRRYKITKEDNLNTISRINYSKNELLDFQRRIKFDSIFSNVRNAENWHYFADTEREQVMMAHLLFNRGIQTGINECLGGTQLKVFTGY